MSSPQPFFESEVPPPVGGAYSGGYSPEPLPPRRNLSPRGRGGRGRGGRGRGGGRLSRSWRRWSPCWRLWTRWWWWLWTRRWWWWCKRSTKEF